MPLRSSIAWLLLIAVAAPTRSDEPASDRVTGVWVGYCRINREDVFVLVSLRPDSASTTAMVQSPVLGMQGSAPVAQNDGTHLGLSFPTSRGTVRLSCNMRDGALVGTAECAGSTGDCSLRRRIDIDAKEFNGLRGNYQLGPDHVLLIDSFEGTNYRFLSDGDLRARLTPVGPREFLGDDLRTVRFELDDKDVVVAALIQRESKPTTRAARVRLYTDEPVTFASGALRLTGTLRLPIGSGPHPAVVFVHGSGPMRPFTMEEADRLARHGIASLTFDKRGTGGSTGDWRRADFDDFADDVLAAVDHLHRDRRIRADQIGLLGFSQAAWVIPMAAARSADVAFIVPISGGGGMPAEYDLWQHQLRLEALGVAPRYREVEHRASAMAFDWHRRRQLGTMPLPNPFVDVQLNYLHDAPPVIRAVRQPVLAIFGGKDNLTPPQECAAVWADALRQSGHRDYSVRLFPGGTHGLSDAKTGAPFEVHAEQRRVAGYYDTIVGWIRHHVGGPEFRDAHRVDVDPDTIPVQSRGLYRLSWYGSGAVQPWLLLVFLLVFASAVLAAPAAWLWRRVWRRDAGPGLSATVVWLAALLGLINLGVLVTFVCVVYQLSQAAPHPVFGWLDRIWDLFAVATWISLVLLVIVGRGCVVAWREHKGSWTGRLYYTAVALVALLWVPFAVFWDLVIPGW
jgi:dienelactone hydrolase